MKIFFIYIFISTLCIPAIAFSQEALAPCEADFTTDYYHELDKVIDGAVKHSSDVSITVIPSFVSEYGVRLADNRAYYVRLQSSLWSQLESFQADNEAPTSSSLSKVRMRIYSAYLEPALVTRIKTIYENAIAKAKQTDIIGLDGISYRFSVRLSGCGKAWSPEESSPNGRLVSLLDLLVLHSKLTSNGDIKKSEKSIGKFLDSLDSGH